MIKTTLPTQDVLRLYDLIGSRYDWFTALEGRAKALALDHLDLAPGMHLLDVGVGTGREHLRIQESITPGGWAFGLDLSPVMLKLCQERSGTPLCQADARHLPYPGDSFDRLYAAYVLDLLPSSDLPDTLLEFRRVLKPGGRLVSISMTEGTGLPSRTIIGAWKAAYWLSPYTCAGCRPLRLKQLVEDACMEIEFHEVITQLGLPSEIIASRKARDAGSPTVSQGRS
jgi:demethylmenaquinone methyltransferase/2-methoxy-6-polyprenyl-1,4-benzoquinol methylase